MSETNGNSFRSVGGIDFGPGINPYVQPGIADTDFTKSNRNSHAVAYPEEALPEIPGGVQPDPLRDLDNALLVDPRFGVWPDTPRNPNNIQ